MGKNSPCDQQLNWGFDLTTLKLGCFIMPTPLSRSLSSWHLLQLGVTSLLLKKLEYFSGNSHLEVIFKFRPFYSVKLGF